MEANGVAELGSLSVRIFALRLSTSCMVLEGLSLGI